MRRMNFYLEELQIGRLILLAGRSGRNVSEVIRDLIEEGLARHELGDDTAATGFAERCQAIGSRPIRPGRWTARRRMAR
jgi:hypothetical protein